MNKLHPIDAKHMSILDGVINLFNKQPVTQKYAKKLMKVRNHYHKMASWNYKRTHPFEQFMSRYVVVTVGRDLTEGILEKIEPQFLVINSGRQTRKDGTSERFYVPIDKITKIERRGTNAK